jgi:hypothetical protein
VSSLKLTFTTMLVAFLSCATLFGQFAAPVPPLKTFHIDGAIQNYNGVPASEAEVTFQGDKNKQDCEHR